MSLWASRAQTHMLGCNPIQICDRVCLRLPAAQEADNVEKIAVILIGSVGPPVVILEPSDVDRIPLIPANLAEGAQL